MKKSLLSIIISVLCLSMFMALSACASAAVPDIGGKWPGTYTNVGVEDYSTVFTISQNGDQFSGTASFVITHSDYAPQDVGKSLTYSFAGAIDETGKIHITGNILSGPPEIVSRAGIWDMDWQLSQDGKTISFNGNDGYGNSIIVNLNRAQSSPSPLSNPIVISGIAAAAIAAVGAVVYFGVIAKGSSAAASAGARVTGATGSTAGSLTGNLGSLGVSDSNFLDSLFNANTAAVGVTRQAGSVGEGSGSSVDVSDGLRDADYGFLDSLYNSSTPTSVGPSQAGSAGSEGVGSGPSLGGDDFLGELYTDASPPTAGTGQHSSINSIISDLLSSEGGFACIPLL